MGAREEPCGDGEPPVWLGCIGCMRVLAELNDGAGDCEVDTNAAGLNDVGEMGFAPRPRPPREGLDRDEDAMVLRLGEDGNDGDGCCCCRTARACDDDTRAGLWARGV
jgi:hypothetical protein